MHLRAEQICRQPKGPSCLVLPRNEMAFRKQYEPLLNARKLTAVFRPGNRVFPNRRGYIVGETVTARVIERCGSDRLGLPPQFNDTRIPILIKRIGVSCIDCIEERDFAGSSPDVFDRNSLIEHLTWIYREPIDCSGATVTKIQFEYLDPAP